jgi:DNA polymerase III epsilon subunit-like protein
VAQASCPAYSPDSRAVILGEALASLSAQVPGLATSNLTRRPAGPDGRGLVFTAVDLETTGFGDEDRIVELAAVIFRGDGEILDEYATLVDPVRQSSSEARELHGLSD